MMTYPIEDQYKCQIDEGSSNINDDQAVPKKRFAQWYECSESV
jgi:hypothetical protein